MHPFIPSAVKQRTSPGKMWLVVMSGLLEPSITTTEVPDAPEVTPALKEILELAKVTLPAVSEALSAFFVRWTERNANVPIKIVRRENRINLCLCLLLKF